MHLLLLVSLQLPVASPAVAVSVHGWVEVQTVDKRANLARFDRIQPGARIITHDDASVQLRLASGSLLRLGENTEVSLNQLEHNDPAGQRKESFRLRVGRVWARVTSLFGGDSKFEVETPTAVAGVRGTSFVAEASGEGDRFVLIEGAIDLLRDDQTVRLDQPGAFVDSAGGGLGTPGVMDTSNLNDLLSTISSTGATVARLQSSTAGGAPGGLTSAQSRSSSRTDIVGPQGIVDTPTSTSPSAEAGVPPGPASGPATIDVIINLPSRAGGDSGSPSP